MSFKIILDGFETKEQAKGFLNWFEGQGEQDETIPMWVGEDVKYITCDVQKGMIEHSDGFEYKLKITKSDS